MYVNSSLPNLVYLKIAFTLLWYYNYYHIPFNELISSLNGMAFLEIQHIPTSYS